MVKSQPFMRGFLLGSFMSIVVMIMWMSLSGPIDSSQSIPKAHDKLHSQEQTHTQETHGENQSFIQISKNVMFWVFVTFIFLVFFLEKYVWKSLLHLLDSRKQSVIKELNQAKHYEEESKHLLDENQKLNKKAYQEAQEIIHKAKKESEFIRQSILLEAQQEANLSLQQTKKSIQLAKEHATEDIKNQIISSSIQIASKLIDRQLNKKEQEQFIQKNIDQLLSMRSF